VSPGGDPDVLRGEEMEIFGLLAAQGAQAEGDTYIALPGTHTKWVRVSGQRVMEFFTSMSGELFDRLAQQSLLTAVMVGAATSAADEAFARGVERGASGRSGLGRLLFGVRAQVLRGKLERRHAASYARGLLIGAEIEDALRLYPKIKTQRELRLLGNSALCALYEAALGMFGVGVRVVDSARSLAAGYGALHTEVVACTT
jgi:2-dehydro-3-deoxygalactonokinase